MPLSLNQNALKQDKKRKKESREEAERETESGTRGKRQGEGTNRKESRGRAGEVQGGAGGRLPMVQINCYIRKNGEIIICALLSELEGR